ncbi:MAG: hypothetical protein A2Z97_02840 [Bdellovibrionales bacterium GWB1_52_6]|nr:MAG: hypothetical protein A2Z97_02840 [Bdellovibrionales bacterium GWB1_52_6]OFZ05833.1 MAG: hypothetical protein A2X97_03990 [Bdellovibrionales bacterium GWA1_52_35]HCM40222.1 DUF1284 domain-containing protein [Bdellovibrionales bacterium]
MLRLKFRAHHFLCALGFQGKGYSPDFVDNFQQKVDLLKDEVHGPAQELEIVEGLDAICEKCPNQDGAHCGSEHKVLRLDQGHAEALGVTNGQIVTWAEMKKRLAERMTLEKFEVVCAPCAWKSLGACRAALETLIKSK